MIKVIIKCRVQAGKADDFIATGSQLAALAMTEPGCVSYQVAQSMQNENVVFLVEEWADSEKLGAHMAKPYFKELSDLMVALQDGDADINACNIIG